jgi:23S rRNA (pseudouridine1915-N3)-methyltransferase
MTAGLMKLLILAVGQRIPPWAQAAWDDYAKRFPPELKVELKAIKTEPRTGGKTAAQCMAAERARIEAALPKQAHIVALDERGAALTTQALAARLRDWQHAGNDVALLIGGPDGLDADLRAAAHERIRLSDLTLPHALARVLLIEQLYRSWSVNAGHPYHRE